MMSQAEQFRLEMLALIESIHATATDLLGQLQGREQWPQAAIVAESADLAGAALVAIAAAAQHLDQD